MARRKKSDRDTQVGCAAILVIGLVMAAVNFVVENATAFIVTGFIIMLVVALAVFMNPGAFQKWWDQQARNAKAIQRNKPALDLLLVLAYDNGSLSNAEIDIITRYMSLVHGFVATPDFRKQLKRQAVYPSDRQRLIDQCLTDLEQIEIDRLRLELRCMKDAHQRRTRDEKARFDDTLYQLGDTQPVPSNPYDISPA